MRAIAEEAGVSLGLAYNYFSGKQELLQSIVEEGVRQVQATLDELDGTVPPEDRLRRFVKTSLDAVRANRAFWQLLYGLRHQPEAVSTVRDDLNALNDDIHAHLCEILTALGDDTPKASARLLYAALDGVGQHYVRDPDTYPLDTIAETIVDRFSVPTE